LGGFKNDKTPKKRVKAVSRRKRAQSVIVQREKKKSGKRGRQERSARRWNWHIAAKPGNKVMGLFPVKKKASTGRLGNAGRKGKGEKVRHGRLPREESPTRGVGKKTYQYGRECGEEVSGFGKTQRGERNYPGHGREKRLGTEAVSLGLLTRQ